MEKPNEYKQQWQCPECQFVTDWSYLDLVERGNPVCPNDDEEMELLQGDKLFNQVVDLQARNETLTEKVNELEINKRGLQEDLRFWKDHYYGSQRTIARLQESIIKKEY